jgi:pimeloyl-ACP methyl ester carboxylesterase
MNSILQSKIFTILGASFFLLSGCGPNANECTPSAEVCNDGIDNDCDALIDCEDGSCAANAVCSQPENEVCAGGLDEDGDNLIDCADPDCAADPSCQVITDPGEPGVFGVKVETSSAQTSLGNAALTVYSPSTDGGATAAAGPFPLVIVSTGFQIGRANYDLTCRHLATWGYLVIIHDYTSGNHDQKATEIGDLIDFALGATSGLAARIDATKIAVAGHSLGGKVSIGAAIDDARIGTVIGWDPVDALPPFGNDGSTSFAPEKINQLTKPIAILGETTDSTGAFGQACAPVADNFQQFFLNACDSPAALEVNISNADHTDWVDNRGACGFACSFCATGTTADATVLTITRRVTVAWLETHLRNQSGFEEFLTTPGIGAPVTLRTTSPACP